MGEEEQPQSTEARVTHLEHVARSLDHDVHELKQDMRIVRFDVGILREGFEQVAQRLDRVEQTQTEHTETLKQIVNLLRSGNQA